MPPPVKDPEAAWSAGTPIESFWLENPKVSLAGDLSAAQERALDLLVKFNGQIKPDKDPVWKEPSDGTWTLEDTAADLRARLIGSVIAQVTSGEVFLFGYVSQGVRIDPEAKPEQLSPAVIAADTGNPREMVFVAAGEPFVTGVVSRGDVRVSDIRILMQTGLKDLEASPSSIKRRRSAHRPNQRDEFKDAARQALANDSAFRALPNRTEQVRELRARLHGEQARMQDTFPGCHTSSAKVWLGEVAQEVGDTD